MFQVYNPDILVYCSSSSSSSRGAGVERMDYYNQASRVEEVDGRVLVGIMLYVDFKVP